MGYLELREQDLCSCLIEESFLLSEGFMLCFQLLSWLFPYLSSLAEAVRDFLRHGGAFRHLATFTRRKLLKGRGRLQVVSDCRELSPRERLFDLGFLVLG